MVLIRISMCFFLLSIFWKWNGQGHGQQEGGGQHSPALLPSWAGSCCCKGKPAGFLPGRAAPAHSHGCYLNTPMLGAWTAKFTWGESPWACQGFVQLCALQNETRRIKPRVWVHKSPSLGLGGSAKRAVGLWHGKHTMASSVFLLPGLDEGAHQAQRPPWPPKVYWISGKNQILEDMSYAHHPLGCSACRDFFGGKQNSHPSKPHPLLCLFTIATSSKIPFCDFFF